jgi:hypothetical protein
MDWAGAKGLNQWERQALEPAEERKPVAAGAETWWPRPLGLEGIEAIVSHPAIGRPSTPVECYLRARLALALA